MRRARGSKRRLVRMILREPRRRGWRLAENNRAFDLAIFQSTGEKNPHPRQAAADEAAAMAAAATAVIKTTLFKYLTKKRAWQRLADWFERRVADKAAAVEAAAATEAAETAAAATAAAAAVATATGRHPSNWDEMTRSQKRHWRHNHRA